MPIFLEVPVNQTQPQGIQWNEIMVIGGKITNSTISHIIHCRIF